MRVGGGYQCRLVAASTQSPVALRMSSCRLAIAELGDRVIDLEYTGHSRRVSLQRRVVASMSVKRNVSVTGKNTEAGEVAWEPSKTALKARPVSTGAQGTHCSLMSEIAPSSISIQMPGMSSPRPASASCHSS